MNTILSTNPRTQQLLQDIEAFIMAGSEIMGQVFVVKDDYFILIKKLQASLTHLLDEKGNVRREQPLRSATLSLINEIEALEERGKEGFEILSRTTIDRAECLQQLKKICEALRYAEQFASPDEVRIIEYP